jgi:hypothetical protein
VLLLSEFLTDLVEDDAVVFSFNDRQTVARTPRPRTLLRWALPTGLTSAGEMVKHAVTWAVGPRSLDGLTRGKSWKGVSVKEFTGTVAQAPGMVWSLACAAE